MSFHTGPHYLSWFDAIRLTSDEAISLQKMHPTHGVTIGRPDGSTIMVFYYPRGHRFRVRRMRVNGQWGVSRYYDADNGWVDCLNYQLPQRMKIQG